MHVITACCWSEVCENAHCHDAPTRCTRCTHANARVHRCTKSGQDLFTHQQQQQQQPLEEKESTLDKPIDQTEEEIEKPIRKSKLRAIHFITGLCQIIKLEKKIEQKEKYQQNKKLKKGTTKIIKRAVRSKKKAEAKTSKMLSWIRNTRTNIDENHNRKTYIPIIQS